MQIPTQALETDLLSVKCKIGNYFFNLYKHLQEILKDKLCWVYFEKHLYVEHNSGCEVLLTRMSIPTLLVAKCDHG